MGKDMRKLALALLLVVMALIATSSLALTGYSYYIPVSIHNTDTVAHTTRITTTINADALIDGGYIQEDGEDIQLTSGATTQSITATQLDGTAAKWYTDYATLAPGASTTRNIWLGDPDAVRDQAWVGMEGDANTVADADSLDITSNLTLQADVNLPALPSTEKTIISKDGAYELTVDDENIILTLGITAGQTAQSAHEPLYSGGATRAGERLATLFQSSGTTISSIQFYLCKSVSPTGTLSVTVRDSATDALIGTLGTKDVSTLSAYPTFTWYTFNSPVTTSVSDVRIMCEYSGGNGSNTLMVGYKTSEAFSNGVKTIYTSGGSYADSSGLDITFGNLTYQSTVSTSATSMSLSTWHTITGTYNGSQMAIGIDSETPVTQATSGNIIATATNVHIGELTAKLDSVKIGSTSIATPTWVLNLEFEPDEVSSTTITDLSASGNDVTYNMVAMDPDIDVTIGKLTPVLTAIYAVPSSGETASGVPVTFPDESDGFFNDLGDYDGFPGSGFINGMLDDAEIPRSAFWLCLFLALIVGGSYFLFDKTRDVLAVAIVTVSVLVLQIATGMGIGIIDLLMLAIFYVALYMRREIRTGGL
ncbi:MAG: hypothetical protein PHV74_06760 [Dehalococcoidia bacterium]|nr:hypothetical protein [Dehalococcoidia bacterium]